MLGAIATVLAAWGAFFTPRESWHVNAKALARLNALLAELEFLERSADFAQQESQCVKNAFDKYQSILSDYSQEWQKFLKNSE